ncbi:MAG: AtpZ/AtpI family protein [Desulfarculaceae bacterium]|nr:AtpZ/AtpI family protein [Desulfarculaceae bacterium]
MQVGLTFAGSVLFCLFVGYWLGEWLGAKKILMVVFILLGIAGGGYTVYRQISELGLNPEDDNQGEPDGDKD